MDFNNKVCLQWLKCINVNPEGKFFNLPTSFTKSVNCISVGNDCGVGIHNVATSIYTNTQVKVWCKPGGVNVVTILVAIGY